MTHPVIANPFDMVMSIKNNNLLRAFELNALSGEIIDRSRYRHNGQVTNGTYNGDRTPYGAPSMDFNGTDAYVKVDSGTQLETDIGNWVTGSIICLFKNPTQPSGIHDIFHIYASGDNQVELRTIEDDMQWLISIDADDNEEYSSAVLDSNWHTCGIGWQDDSGDGVINYYFDGASEGTDTVGNNKDWNEAPDEATIGAARFPNTQFFDGSIAAVFLWNTRLTATEFALASRILLVK